MRKRFTIVCARVAALLFLLSVAISTTAATHHDVRQGLTGKAKSACRRGEVIVMYRTTEGAQLSRSHSGESRLAGVLKAIGAKEICRFPTHTATGSKSAKVSNAGATADRRSVRLPERDPRLDDMVSRISLLSFDTTCVSTEEEAARLLMALDEVELAEPNLEVSIQPWGMPLENPALSTPLSLLNSHPSPLTSHLSSPNYHPLQWYLEAINMPQLWQQPVINAKRPVVAIVDTGVDINHPELKDNIAEGGFDFVTDTTIIFDANGHGTHCAGLVAAAGNLIAGANPDALILPITVVDSLGSGGLINILSGIVHARNNGADIISLSLGSYGSSSLYRAIVQTVSEQCIIVAAAGNEGFCMHSTHRDLHGMATPHLPCLPAAYETTIGVMATNEVGELASWSNFDCNGPLRGVTQTGFEGWGYQLRVPGNHMVSTLPGGEYGYMSGTSMATPLAAGAISRLLQCRNYESREEMVRTLIMTTHGHIDLMAALQATPETLHPGLFTEEIDGLTMTFKETSDSTAQLGDGYTAALQAAQVGERLTVPNEVRGLSVTALAPHALEGCATLKTVRLGCNVEEIGNAAFHDCTALQELAFDTRFPPTASTAAFDSRHFQTVTLRNAKGYEENYMKNFQTEAPWSSFSRWQELDMTTGNRFWETIDTQGTRMSFIVYNLNDGYAQVGDGEMCIDSLRAGHLTIPSSVKGLDVVIVGDEAFHGCNLLTSVLMPNTMLQIWYNAFAGCTGLTDIYLPDGVSYIGGRAFNGCENLRTLRLSKQISTIGNYAFAGCRRLKIITVPCAEPPKIDENIFLARTPLSTGDYDLETNDGDIYRQATLFVPNGSRALYAKAPGWHNFRYIEEMEAESITTLTFAPSLISSQTIYDLTGRKVQQSPTIIGEADHSTVNTQNSTFNIQHSTLKKGVYIIGNRKYIK